MRRPHEPPALKGLGDEWATSRRTCILTAPSAIIPQEPNYLINPLHPGNPCLTKGPALPFPFDRRLGSP